jgi:hypothetical protein
MSRTLDDILGDLLRASQELEDLDDGDVEGRLEIQRRQESLRSEARDLQGGIPDSRSSEDVLAELTELRTTIDRATRRKERGNASTGMFAMGQFADAVTADMLVSASRLPEFPDLDVLVARARELESILATRGVEF